MVVTQSKFNELLSKYNNQINQIPTNLTISFNKELIDTDISKNKTTLSFSVETLKNELTHFNVADIKHNLSWFRKVFNPTITATDFSKFYTYKNNKLIDIKTELMLAQKGILKTILLIDEELTEIKSSLKINKKNKNNLLKVITKITELEIKNDDDIIVNELENKRDNILNDIKSKLETIDLNNIVLTQNVEILKSNLRELKKLNKSLEELVTVVIPNWTRYFTIKLMNKEITSENYSKHIEQINEETNIFNSVNKLNDII